MTGKSRSIAAVAAASLLAGCAHTPYPQLGQNEVVDIAGEHPHLNRASNFCTEHEVLCIVAGFAVMGGVVAALKD